eukprot:GFUD01028891.1.p1 GENE.GFUD01028891.1~~GFUD01028891.1.p1  ORF type:complete len:531 (+),score=132.72 GFUD01028891.1:105-1697(+)
MPNQKCALSLRKLCMIKISVKFELICYGMERTDPRCKKFIEKVIENVDLSDVLLSYLPSSILYDLLEVTSNERTCAHHILHLLLQPHLRRCKIPPKINTRTAFHLLTARCGSLTHLEIPFCKFIDSGYWTEFFKNFQELRLLNLQGTKIDDFALEQIGLHCPKLVSLNLANTPVSSKGLGFISEPQLSGFHPCQHLAYLNILETDVIPFGVYEFIIYHKNIQKIEYETFDEVLKCFTTMSEAQGHQESSTLKNLNFLNCQGNFTETLEKCTKIFNSLDSISLMKSDLTKQVLDHIPQFQSLTKLELGNSTFTQYTVYFHENVVPILENLGNKLLDLRLEKFKFVDITAIGEHCPKLQVLKLSRILSFCNTDYSSKHSLLNLLDLSILNTKGCRITEETLRLLLASQSLQTIHFQFIASISDQFLLSIIQDNPLDNLDQFILQQCHNITVNTLTLLLSCAAQLATLSCWSCAMVGEASRDQIGQIIKEDNLDVHFQWYSSRLVPIPDDLEELALHAVEHNYVPGILDLFPV